MTRLRTHPEPNRNTRRHDICGLLLAAGSGTRFHASAAAQPQWRDVPGKLLAPLPGSDLLVAQASARALTQVLARVIAVVPPNAAPLATVLQDAGCEILMNPHAHRGMGASLALGARTVQSYARQDPRLCGCLVALADMPWIRPDTLRALCDASASPAAVAPFYQGRRGHPVRFGLHWLDRLASLQGDVGASALLQQTPPSALPCDDPGVLRDVDTVADLQSASVA